MANKNEHLVVVMLEDMPLGQEFENWPPHITIVPWFPVNNETKLDEVLAQTAFTHNPLKVTTGNIEHWGNKDVFEVMRIEDRGQLQKLHQDVFDSLESNGFPIHQKDYLGEKYMPHVTLRNFESKNYRPANGTQISIGKFSLVKQIRLKGSGRMIKTLVRDYELG